MVLIAVELALAVPTKKRTRVSKARHVTPTHLTAFAAVPLMPLARCLPDKFFAPSVDPSRNQIQNTGVSALQDLWGMLPHSVAPDRRFVAESATVVHMARAVSIRELRNSTSAVVSELEAGERLTLTVNRRPVADILPHVENRDPWVPASELRRIVTEAPADAGLLDDLADVRSAEFDD